MVHAALLGRLLFNKVKTTVNMAGSFSTKHNINFVKHQPWPPFGSNVFFSFLSSIMTLIQLNMCPHPRKKPHR